MCLLNITVSSRLVLGDRYLALGWLHHLYVRAGYSMVPRLVVCQIRAQPRGASGVRAGHGLAGEGL